MIAHRAPLDCCKKSIQIAPRSVVSSNAKRQHLIVGQAQCSKIRRTTTCNENRSDGMKYWEAIADNLGKAGLSWGWVAAIDHEGRTIFQEWLDQMNVGLMFWISSTRS